MKHSSTMPIVILAAAIILFLGTLGAGAFSVSVMRRECAEESSRIKKLERELSSLKRENEYWSTQIAQSKDPAILRKRAEGRLVQTGRDRVVYAYQIFDPTKPVGSQRMVAFSRPQARRISTTVQR